MDIQTLLHNLHEEVSCSMCMATFTDPRQLPCLHSFCVHCLQRAQETSGIRETISCAECRQNFRIPESGDLNALQTDFRINSLLDVLAIKERRDTSGVECSNCDKRITESSYCFQCCSFWCDDCLLLHNGIKTYNEHHALALKDFQDEDFENILNRPAFCGKPGHEKKELEFCCSVCEVAICNACALIDHDGHAKMLLEAAAKERKLRVMSAIELQKGKAQRKTTEIAKLDENCVKIKEHAVRVKRDVQQFVDSIFGAIEGKKMEIFDDVENKVKESLESGEIQRNEIEKQVKMHEAAIQESEILLKRSTSAQIMQPNERLDKILQEEGDLDKTSNLDVKSLPNFGFENNQQFLSYVIAEQIGCLQIFPTCTTPKQSSVEGKGISEATVGLEAQIAMTTRNADGEQCYEERDCVTVEFRNRQGHDCATIAQVQDDKDGTYNIRYFAKETGTCQASVRVNGEHVHGSPFEVQVQPRQFKAVVSFGGFGSSAGMLNRPWGITVNERNEIAVTDFYNHRIQAFDSNGTFLRSIGGNGGQQGWFHHPRGVAFHGDNIIVVDSTNHRIQLFTDQGEYVGQFGGEGSLDHQLKNPRGLSIDSDGNIIIADTDNKVIKIFSPDGEILRKIGTEGSFTMSIHCIQHGSYLIVSDFSGHCVNVFNKEGKFLYKFGKQGDGDGEFNYPGCLSVSKADRLLVCDLQNHRVQVFELSGKFLTKFGTKGNGTGEFDWPLSTAVLSDGRIAVSDYRNHRIQIFE